MPTTTPPPTKNTPLPKITKDIAQKNIEKALQYGTSSRPDTPQPVRVTGGGGSSGYNTTMTAGQIEQVRQEGLQEKYGTTNVYGSQPQEQARAQADNAQSFKENLIKNMALVDKNATVTQSQYGLSVTQQGRTYGELYTQKGYAPVTYNVPVSARVNPVALSEMPKPEEEIKPALPEDKKIYGTYNKAKTKVPLTESIFQASQKQTGYKGILLGIGAAGIGYGIGRIEGFTSVFKPSTYTNLFYSVTHPRETVEQIGLLGGEVYRNPVLGFQIVGQFQGFGQGMKIAGKGLQNIQKLRPAYVSPKATNIQMVEGVTIPTKLNVLKSFEGKTVPTVHTTLSSGLKIGSELQPAAWEKITGWRASIGQRGFYTSSPLKVEVGYKPVAYGGYIGIGEGYSASQQVSFSLLPKAGRAFIFRETEISKTPAFIAQQNVKQVVKFQTENAGTYVAAENIKGMSIEGQFTTSVGKEGEALIKVSKGQGELNKKFTYYNVKKPVPFLLGGEKSSKPIKLGWDLLTSENKKVKFIEAKFEKIKPETSTKENILNIQKYSDSQGKKYISSGSIASRGVFFSSLSKSSPIKSLSLSSSSLSKSISKSPSKSSSVSSSVSSLSSSSASKSSSSLSKSVSRSSSLSTSSSSLSKSLSSSSIFSSGKSSSSSFKSSPSLITSNLSLPSLPYSIEGTRKKKKKSIKNIFFKTKYTPSIEATFLNIRGTKIPSQYKFGLDIRPIVR